MIIIQINTTITFSVQFLPKYIDDIASTIITYDVEVLADTNTEE